MLLFIELILKIMFWGDLDENSPTTGPCLNT